MILSQLLQSHGAPKFGHHDHTPEKSKKFRENGQSVRWTVFEKTHTVHLTWCLNRNYLQVTSTCRCNPLRPLYTFIETHEEVACGGGGEWFDRFILKTWRLKHPRILTSPAACETASHITGKPRSRVYRRGSWKYIDPREEIREGCRKLYTEELQQDGRNMRHASDTRKWVQNFGSKNWRKETCYVEDYVGG